jgi:DNA-binding GntR family transcriptional regulator
VPVPDLADRRPPYQQIAADVRRQIKAGHYAPGDRLPSVKQMSETYGSAADTVRHALDVLRAEGLVATQATRGTFVLRAVTEDEDGSLLSRLATGLEDALQRLGKVEERLAAYERESGSGQP